MWRNNIVKDLQKHVRICMSGFVCIFVSSAANFEAKALKVWKPWSK